MVGPINQYVNNVTTFFNLLRAPDDFALQTPTQEPVADPVLRDPPGDLADFDGMVWKCISSRPDPETHGYLITFELNVAAAPPEEIAKKIKGINDELLFPAIQLSPNRLGQLINNCDYGYYNRLGYTFDEDTSTLTMPDCRALKERWKQLQIEEPDFPPLSIYDCREVLNDSQFIKAYTDYDVLLSKGEFVHDQTVHVIPTIRLILRSYLAQDNGFYEQYRKRTVTHYKTVFEKINYAKSISAIPSALPESLRLSQWEMENLDKLYILIAAQIDTLWSMSADYDNRFTSDLLASWLIGSCEKDIEGHNAWAKYLKNRFNIKEENTNEWIRLQKALDELNSKVDKIWNVDRGVSPILRFMRQIPSNSYFSTWRF